MLNIHSFTASVIDKVLLLILRVLPVFSGSYVSYSKAQAQHSTWGATWSTPDSHHLQLGGYEVILDKRTPVRPTVG